MAAVAEGAPITAAYREHLSLCLACRGCESACPSGVEYGKLIELARADIERRTRRPFGERFLRSLVFDHLLPNRRNLRLAGWLLRFYQVSGLRALTRASGVLRLAGKLGPAESLAPEIESPMFFANYGKVFPAQGETRSRVALLAGCIQNLSFARLHEAAIRVLQRHGCEVHVPAEQTCCGALHVHAGLREQGRRLARRNIDAIVDGSFDAILTCTAGCGSTLKEYPHLLEHDSAYADKARRFSAKIRDITEFLAGLPRAAGLGRLAIQVTYQDSCHLAHGQKIRSAPRELLKSIPGLELREMALSDLCCGSAGIYNVVEPEMASALLARKMEHVNRTGAGVIATANPGCIIQLRAGAARHGKAQRVAHVLELLEESYAAHHER
jgi:glycolate oxidase iron-sulfur subunit